MVKKTFLLRHQHQGPCKKWRLWPLSLDVEQAPVFALAPTVAVSYCYALPLPAMQGPRSVIGKEWARDLLLTAWQIEALWLGYMA